MSNVIDEILKKHQRGLVLVYTGNGKGKTTAALGQAMRTLGHGKRILLLQFMKGKDTGEEAAASFLGPNFIIKSCNKNLRMIGDSPSSQDVAEAKEGINIAHCVLEARECDLLILDEANIAVYIGLIEEQEIISLIKMIKAAPLDISLIITGRYASPEIIKLADTVSDFEQVKHHYYAGIEERAGIEY